jgi:tRNASer (uridine44-2'-O)-methyltransferase
VHHPEYNSTLILRSEIISEMDANFPDEIPAFKAYTASRNFHRKLLARRPGRDPSLEQHCTFYVTDGSQHISLLVLTPLTTPDSPLPYYHPAVSHLAFRYIPNAESMLQIDVVPLPNTPLDINSRLYRTCLALLETVNRYGWGAMTNYKKRMHHDTIIPREAYQDLYLTMRERHKHIIGKWQEETDPLKHVFEV